MEETIKAMLEELETAYQLTAGILVSGSGVDSLAEVRNGLRRAHRLGKQGLEETGHGGPD